VAEIADVFGFEEEEEEPGFGLRICEELGKIFRLHDEGVQGHLRFVAIVGSRVSVTT
jgi:hypothetical protein